MLPWIKLALAFGVLSLFVWLIDYIFIYLPSKKYEISKDSEE